jgi:hypothetical protein
MLVSFIPTGGVTCLGRRIELHCMPSIYRITPYLEEDKDKDHDCSAEMA